MRRRVLWILVGHRSLPPPRPFCVCVGESILTTCAITTESEKLVQAAFERVSKGRTTVAVAHRLATIQGADVIYVLGEGKVLEKGTHAELLRQKGVYWHMVSLPLFLFIFLVSFLPPFPAPLLVCLC